MTARPSSAGRCRRWANPCRDASPRRSTNSPARPSRCAAPAAPTPACMRWARSRISISRANGRATRCGLPSISISSPTRSRSSTAPSCRSEFDARFSAIARHYRYRILARPAPPVLDRDRVWWVPQPLSAEAMRAAAAALVGRHDFTTFRAAGCQAKSPVKTLDRLDVAAAGDEIVIAGLGALVPAQPGAIHGRLAQAGGRGQMERERPRRRPRRQGSRACGPVAPARGLYLVQVDYAP